jgi:uncharacterized membrane protein
MTDIGNLGDFGDRLLITVVVVTGFGAIFAWWSGFLEAQVDEPAEYLLRGGLVLLFLVLMVGIWRRFKSMDEAA